MVDDAAQLRLNCCIAQSGQTQYEGYQRAAVQGEIAAQWRARGGGGVL